MTDPTHAADTQYLAALACERAGNPLGAASRLFAGGVIALQRMGGSAEDVGALAVGIMAPAMTDLGVAMTRDGCPPDVALAERLATLAVCATDRPADAIAGLMHAAGSILCRRFSPEVAVELLTAAMRDALLMARPAGAG